MKLTNRNNFPDALVRALKNDTYTKGESDFSVTELLKPPRIRALEKKHEHEIEEDVEDRLYSLYGQLAHLLIERANESDIVEKRFFARFSGVTVSAQVDSLSVKNDTLTDWKFVTAYKFRYGMAVDELWTAQLNMQLEILRQNGMDAKKIQIVGLIRDFSKPESRRNESYPKTPVVTCPIDMWPREQTVKFINERVRLHLDAQKRLPLCSDEDRWATANQFAVMKRGNKRAIKLFTSMAEAKALVDTDSSLYIEPRVGESKRCAMYCKVSEHCSQYQKILGDKNGQSGSVVA